MKMEFGFSLGASVQVDCVFSIRVDIEIIFTVKILYRNIASDFYLFYEINTKYIFALMKLPFRQIFILFPNPINHTSE